MSSLQFKIATRCPLNVGRAESLRLSGGGCKRNEDVPPLVTGLPSPSRQSLDGRSEIVPSPQCNGRPIQSVALTKTQHLAQLFMITLK